MPETITVPKPPPTDDDIELLAMHDGGIPISEIAREMGMSNDTVSRILKEHGRDTSRKAKPVDETGITQDYLDEVSVPDILAKYGISYARLYKVLEDNGVPTRKAAQSEVKSKRLEHAVSLYQNGMPLWAIKQETGVSQPTLHEELHKRNVPLRRERML